MAFFDVCFSRRLARPHHFVNEDGKARGTVFLGLAVLGAILLASPAGSQTPQTLNISNSPNLYSTSPRIVTDSQGNVHAVWVEQPIGADQESVMTGDVYYARGSLATLQISAPINISNINTVWCSTLEMCSIDVDAADRVYVLWTEGRRIVMRTNTGGVWDSGFVVATGPVYDGPRISVTPGGDVFIIYWTNEGHVLSRARVNGVWEEEQSVGRWEYRTKLADIAIGTNLIGAAWVERPGSDQDANYQTAYAQRARTFNAPWGSSVQVAPSGHNQQHAAIELDSSDVPHVIWTTEDGGQRIVHHVRGNGSSFSAPTAISGSSLLHYPFAAERGDDLYVCWQVGGYRSGSSISYNIRENGVWKGVAAVPSSNGSTYSDLAVTPDKGILFVVWDVDTVSFNGEIFGWAKTFPSLNPSITLGRDKFYFGAIAGGVGTPSQSLSVTNSGSAPKSWTATPLQNWITVQPGTGAGTGLIAVGVNASGLSVGSHTGTISVADPNAPQYLPKTVSVTLTVFAAGTTSSPFGSFDTPVSPSTVQSNVPVTGWALDDLGVRVVKIYRDPVSGEPAGSYIYIGDAVLVEGARGDVALSYPSWPMNQRAGWGYMLLTNFFPGLGNGTFTLRAVAEDFEGRTTELGSKTIVCDNAHAVKPFGAIDTPTQGGTASGSGFINFGWALTPLPAGIPFDGSTINVWVDGVPLGSPTYNQRRDDIATLFPGYVNSNGAVGYAPINTTLLTNGVHVIAWSVRDNAANEDGIGSRFFSVFNAGSSSANVDHSGLSGLATGGRADEPLDWTEFATNIRLPVFKRTGFNRDFPAEAILPGRDNALIVEIRETERLEVLLAPNAWEMDVARRILGTDHFTTELPDRNRSGGFEGFLLFKTELRPLPIGSSLDSETGVFSWFPGPGFLGDYRFVFIDRSLRLKNLVTVRIRPKY